MQLKYGNYFWAVSSVTAKMQTRQVLNAMGMPEKLTNRMTVAGSLLPPVNTTTPNADLTAMSIQMQTALNVPYQDLVLLTNDEGNGVGPSATLLTNLNSLSGVRLVDGPNFESDRTSGEYAVQRPFAFTMESMTLAPNQITPLHSFTESLSYSGGQPIKQMCRNVNGPPIDQVVWPFTEYEVVQSGVAVGLAGWPFGGPNIMPPYRFPQQFLRGAPVIEPSGPERVGPAAYLMYSIRYSAKFASATPLVAAPTLWT